MKTYKANLHFLLHCADLVEDELRRRLIVLDIRPRQARIIDALGRIGTASQITLAREFNVTPASMSTMTSRLIDAGYISRETDPEEARSNLLRLTDHGQSLLSDIYKAWRDVDRMIAKQLGPEQSELLASLTRDLRDKLGGRVPGTLTIENNLED